MIIPQNGRKIGQSRERRIYGFVTQTPIETPQLATPVGVCMAIYSLHHTWLGKSHVNYKPGVGRAHANYITRESSCTRLFGARMPTERQWLKAWLNAQEIGDRKNARIIDKVMVALPIELTPSQREALIRAYCEQVSEGRTGWVAAIHDLGKDAHNPHAHIIFRDRDVVTGRRVIMTTERGSTERLRKDWEEAANRALEDAGLDIRIDRRSLAAQGIQRDAPAHRGPTIAAKKREVELPPIAQQDTQRNRTDDRVDHSPDLHWTGRGGMVAQQRSAASWAKAANIELTERSEAARARKRTAQRERFRVTLNDEQKAELERYSLDGARGGIER